MNNKPNAKKNWLRGSIRASLLAAACVCVAAEDIDFRETSWVIHNAISPRQIRKSRSLTNLRGK
jgi:hypothetical protein